MSKKEKIISIILVVVIFIVLFLIINRTNLLASYSKNITASVNSSISSVYYSDLNKGASGSGSQSGSQSGSDSGYSDEDIDDRDTFVPVLDEASKSNQCADGIVTKEDGQMNKYTFIGYKCTLGSKYFESVKLVGTQCLDVNGGCLTYYVNDLGKVKGDKMRCKSVIKGNSVANCDLTPEDDTPSPRGNPAFCIDVSGNSSTAGLNVNPCSVISHTFTVVPTKGKTSFFSKNRYDNDNLISQLTKSEKQALCNNNKKCQRDTRVGGSAYNDPDFALRGAAREYEKGLSSPGILDTNNITVQGCKSTEKWVCKWTYEYSQ